MREVDVVVIGAGVMGAASAWRLAEAGRAPVVLEQFEAGHPHGSSHGSVRVFRFSYGDPVYVRMAMEALPLWRELERDSGREILTPLGQLDWREPYVSANAAALRQCGADATLIGVVAAADPEQRRKEAQRFSASRTQDNRGRRRRPMVTALRLALALIISLASFSSSGWAYWGEPDAPATNAVGYRG